MRALPKIFTGEDRDIIRRSLLENGRKAIEKDSYKNISVADIAAQTGIAKGTFYNFFSSKEEFFYEIMLIIRDENRREIEELMECPDRERVYSFFYKRYTEVRTVYDYFTRDELNIIFRRLPHKQTEADEDSVRLAKKLISVCTDSSAVRAEVVINLMNIAAAASADRVQLLSEHYAETVSVLARAITDYIFSGNGEMKNEHHN